MAKSSSKQKTKSKQPRSSARKSSKKGKAVERESGPRKWFFPLVEAAYRKLEPIDKPQPAKEARHSVRMGAARSFKSTMEASRGEEVLSHPSEEYWLRILSQYKQRKAESVRPPKRARTTRMTGPIIPGQKNWAPLGPSVITQGQAHGFPSVSGRISGIAIDSTGQIIYVASANGGVFRSRDAGITWKSMMDAFDTDPVNFASTSLCCGAIAIDKDDPNRVYVGTGEGNTFHMFQSRLTNALPAYRGIGPIRSDDGGGTWILEKTAVGSPKLAGKSFFALAVDPANRENVVAATSEGLYHRVVSSGKISWRRRLKGVFSSVVSAFAGSTAFYAAKWGHEVVHSSDGKTWKPVSNGFPTANVGRIELAVQPTNPNLLYALIANTSGGLLGIYRYESGAQQWKKISEPPDVLPSGGEQGDYDLAIAVDPTNANLIYVGGSFYSDQYLWPASIWRCMISKTSTGFTCSSTAIGQKAHADVHVLIHAPGNSNALWSGTDGGVFLNRNPKSSDNFDSRNNGLACLCTNFIAQHPTDPGIMFTGLQDNGTARTGGSPMWKHVCWGDGGYCLINWSNPKQVLVFANGSVYRATDGGLDHNSWTSTRFPWAMMTEPIVGPPYNPANPDDARIVALGSADKNTYKPKVYLSTNFGSSWTTEIPIPSSGGIYAMAFASARRFFVGTVNGEVFRVDNSGNQWRVSQINNVPGKPLPLRGIISDIAIDWSDGSGASIYVAFGGHGDYRHVWHFDGVQWASRSGKNKKLGLLDVEHNAIAVDKMAPANIYLGADIGVWHSADYGVSWQPLPNGLPDAPVFDLQIHSTQRLLRAATHGRGVFEYAI